LRFHLTTNGHEWMRIYNLFALFGGDPWSHMDRGSSAPGTLTAKSASGTVAQFTWKSAKRGR
jgi:hypothetical protein